MNEPQQEQPFKILGDKLKIIRQKLHESVAEVSGAVEIDEQSLQRIEQGKERPSEDILMLLINHFGVQDDDAANLWQLAGYDDPGDEDHNHNHAPQENQNRTMVMIMAVDPRVIYSDGAQVTANANGVILGFSQGVGTPGAITTAKIGMSREQAKALLHTLGRTLEASEPKKLPGLDQSKSQDQQQQS